MQPEMGSGESRTSDVRRSGLPFLPLPPVRTAFEWLSTLEQDRWPEPTVRGRSPSASAPRLPRRRCEPDADGQVAAHGRLRPHPQRHFLEHELHEPVVTSVLERVERAVERSGRPAMLVGQSRGGTIARALCAVLHRRIWSTLRHLGSPSSSIQLDVLLPLGWLSIGGRGLARGSLGVPGCSA